MAVNKDAFDQARAVLKAATKGEDLVPLAKGCDKKDLADALRATREACLMWWLMYLESLINFKTAFYTKDHNQDGEKIFLESTSQLKGVWQGIEDFCNDVGLTAQQLLAWYQPVTDWLEELQLCHEANIPAEGDMAAAVRETLHQWTFYEWANNCSASHN